MTSPDCSTPLSKTVLREFILQELLASPTTVIEDDQDLLMSGLLDSISVVRLASYIEENGQIQIPPEDLLLENFGSLNQMDAYLKARSAN